MNYTLRMLLVSVFFVLHDVVYCLEMMACATGQANAIFMRNAFEKKAVVFDYGGYAKWGRFNIGDPGVAVLNFLEGRDITVIVTHCHSDHHELLTEAFLRNQQIKIVGKYYSRGGDGTDPNRFNEYTQLDLIIGNIPHDILGANVLVEQILYKEQPSSRSANDYSVPFVITYGNSKILITGDASGNSLNSVQRRLENDQNEERKLTNITYLVLPHHGSNADGGYAWFDFVKSNVTQDFQVPLVTLISSDPNGRDKLPWFGVKRFDCSRNGNRFQCAEHMISTGSGDFPITIPLFVTKNAKSGFWITAFDENPDNIGIYDGFPEFSHGVLNPRFVNHLVNSTNEVFNFNEQINK